MKIIKFCFSCLILVLVTNYTATSQTSSQLIDLPNIVPPSPNAASLGKFGDIPVGNYTGIPNISIPLYQMKVGAFSLPISLSYHSGGLKVEEISGSVGLGWALNAGGVITRSLHGLPDESGTGYWQNSSWTNEYISSDLTITSPFCTGGYDKQPDIFYFNFAGQSGKFIMDNTVQHNARFIPFSNFKLTHDASLTNFHITDANGIVYIFSSRETTTEDNIGSLLNFTSAWYITTIQTPAGDINFTYNTELTDQTQVSESDFLNVGASPCNIYCPGYQSSTSDISVNALILSQITTPFETLTFNTQSNRRDMPTASSIIGFSVSASDGTIVKKFQFLQSYFGDVFSTDQTDLRLKLDEIDEISTTDDTQRKKYIFQYFSPESVPSLDSYAKDYWGFYNGADGNVTTLPFIDPTVYGPYIANQATLYGNREPDYAKAEIGVLQSIQYPTGGTSQFVYEGNDYSASDGVGISQIPHIQHNSVANAKIEGSINIPSNTSTFSITSVQSGSFIVTGSYSGPAPVENGPSFSLNRINTDGSRTNIYQVFTVNNTQTFYPFLEIGNYEIVATVDGSNQSMLATMRYFELDSDPTHLIHIFPTGGIRIKQIVNSDPITGNLNTKNFNYRSTDDPSLSSGVLVSDYLTLDTKTGFFSNCSYKVRATSSANYLGVTQGSHVGYGTVAESNDASNNNGRKESYYSTSMDFPNTFAMQYGVRQPNTLMGLDQNKRYQNDYDVFRGLLKKELIFNASGNLLRSTVNTYNFADAISVNSPNYYAAAVTVGYTTHICNPNCSECPPPGGWPANPPGTCGTYFLDNYTLVNYQIFCPWIYTTNTTTLTYDQFGANPVVENINYYYDNPVHGKVTRIITTNSKGESIKKLNFYPGDKNQIVGLPTSLGSVLDAMVSRNMISRVIQQERFDNENLVSRTRTDYQIWPGARNNISPSEIWLQNGNHAIENRLNFLSYDDRDNLLQVHKTGDENISYVWDYNSAYPIAEIKNANNSDVAFTSFESDGTGNFSFSSSGIDNTKALTGNTSYQLSAANSIIKSDLSSNLTYVISYWSRNGSYDINGSAAVAGHSSNGWTYYEHTAVHPSGNSITISGNGNIDELRLYPQGALMSSYTYSPLIGATSKSDETGRIVFFEYDGLQRLKALKDQDGNIIKRYDYQFQYLVN